MSGALADIETIVDRLREMNYEDVLIAAGLIEHQFPLGARRVRQIGMDIKELRKLAGITEEHDDEDTQGLRRVG